MNLTLFQRWVVAVAAILVALRLFFPIHYAPGSIALRIDLTLLHVVGIIVIAAALFFLMPTPSRKVVWWTKLGLILVVIVVVLAFVRAVQVERSRQERVRLMEEQAAAKRRETLEECAAAQRRATAGRPDPYDKLMLKYLCPTSGR
jgi:small-conductance mechanosensitive channel